MTSTSMPLIMCTKSPWDPPVRREHAWVTMAAKHGHQVVFLASPLDVRALRRRQARMWFDGFGDGQSRVISSMIVVKRRSTFVPGHRNAVAARLDSQLL